MQEGRHGEGGHHVAGGGTECLAAEEAAGKQPHIAGDQVQLQYQVAEQRPDRAVPIPVMARPGKGDTERDAEATRDDSRLNIFACWSVAATRVPMSCVVSVKERTDTGQPQDGNRVVPLRSIVEEMPDDLLRYRHHRQAERDAAEQNDLHRSP